jgi:putative addiction module component (TIGR02574 family)
MNKPLMDELLQLDPAERLDIAVRLWESVHPPGSTLPGESVELTEEQMQEIRRRVAEHAQNPGAAVPWEEVRTRLWARLK